MSTPKSKASSSSRSLRRSSRTCTAAKPVAHRSGTSRVSSSVKQAAVATVVPALVKKVLSKVKTKTGLAIDAGVAMAGVGLARKYRAVH